MTHFADSPMELSSVTKNQRLARCYERGLQLTHCDDANSYAHAMFSECVVHEPGNVVFVEALLRNCASGVPNRQSRFRLQSLTGIGRPLAQAMALQRWKDAMRIGVAKLEFEPWNVALLRALAETCAHLHCNESELAFLKQALNAAPKNLELNRHCANSLARMGQFDQAIACWHRVEAGTRHGTEAKEMISKLCTAKLMYPNGRPPEIQAAVHVVSASQAEDQLNGEILAARLSTRQRLERNIAENPRDPSNYILLAKLLVEGSQFRQAIEVLRRADAECAEKPAILEFLKQIEELWAEHELRLVQARETQRAKTNKWVSPISGVELALIVASTSLVLQLFFPAALLAVLAALDFRNWSRVTWFTINVTVMVLLLSLRWWPALQTSWHEVSISASRRLLKNR